jgi:Protein of unknown function (DUF3662)/Inner membrane component of T3SS, cytoplasmic domain
MGILSDFERRLEGAIEGIFSKAFRGGVQPVELARRILKEMEAGRTVGVRETWVPNRFAFVLSPEDHERFQQTENALRRELEQVVRDEASSRGWGLVGPPEVTFEREEDLREGRFLCEASLVEGPDASGQEAVAAAEAALAAKGADAAGPAATGAPPELITLAGPTPGKVFELTKDRVSLGRLPDCDILLADSGASRQHAEIRQQGGEWVIADLGSTNGTMVNELTIGERALHDGDRITIGRTVLEFRSR